MSALQGAKRTGTAHEEKQIFCSQASCRVNLSDSFLSAKMLAGSPVGRLYRARGFIPSRPRPVIMFFLQQDGGQECPPYDVCLSMLEIRVQEAQ